MRLLFANGAMQRLTVAAREISQTLEAQAPAAPKTVRTPNTSNIEFQGVFFGYDHAKDAVRNIDFTLPERKVTALVGPSGAGKTTLIRLIARYWDARAGSVRIGGVDVRDIPADRLQRLVSIVFQDPYFFHGSVRENLAIAAPDSRAQDLETALCAAGLANLMQRLPHGLDTLIGDRGTRLSSGERQRLAIARALLKDAPILLLDEATAFADPEHELTIQRAIAKLTVGRTVVVVAHRLATIQSADVIAVMREGEIEASGDHGALLRSSPVYRDLWGSQQRAMNWGLSTAHEMVC